MLTEQTYIDQISVSLPAGHIRVRTATRILKDGKPVGPDTYHSVAHSPGDDLTGADPRVAAIAAALAPFLA